MLSGLCWLGANSTWQGEVDRLVGHTVEVTDDDYRIVDIAGEGKPHVGCVRLIGKTLYLEFEHVYAPGGGGYSGAKSVAVVGELKENGEVIASLTVSRAALFGMAPGTCSMLKRVAKKLGQDIGNWLEAPEMDSMLGDAAN